jgi:NADH-quinone oxidoreductase subunit M
MLTSWPLLSLLVWLPIAAGIFNLFFIGERHPGRVRLFSLLTTIVSLVIVGVVYWSFDATLPDYQLVERISWIPSFNIEYYLGVDGIALPLVILTCITGFIVVIAGWRVIQERVADYYAAFLIMQGLMNGVFLAVDSLLFYVLWEAMLIPMFLIIGIWGGPRRVYAAVKFFLYTFLGSVFMLVGLLYLYIQGNSFAIPDLYHLNLPLTTQVLIFIGFFLAFAVKIPMWPVHTWLPDAHVEAPTGGSVVLAAIMLKMGGYGFIRFSLPMVPEASQLLAPVVIGLSLIAIVYVGLVAIVQKDMKKLIAYSSIAHMGFVTLGLFLVFPILSEGETVANAALGIQGAMVQMISHGFISAALFLCVGVLYDRVHSRNIADYGGVANTMPKFAALFILFAMANTGLPGTSGFVGEFMVILASAKANIWIAIVAATTLVWSAAYSLWMYRRVVYGDVANQQVAHLTDIEGREIFMLVVLAVAVLLLGIWPEPLLHIMDASILDLVAGLPS